MLKQNEKLIKKKEGLTKIISPLSGNIETRLTKKMAKPVYRSSVIRAKSKMKNVHNG